MTQELSTCLWFDKKAKEIVDKETVGKARSVDEIKFQQWANVNQNTVLEEVLKSVTFLQFSPFKNPNNQLEKPIKIELIEVIVE